MDAVTFAVVPSVGGDDAALEAMCAALGERLGTRLRGARPPSYGALLADLEAGRTQFAWMPPVLMVLAEERVAVRPILSAVRGGSTTYSAVLFVDGAGPLHRLDDLTGRTVAWVDQTSASGYLAPRLELAARGIDTATLFARQLFLGSHRDVVLAVQRGQADVGATYAERPAAGAPIRRAGFVDVAPGWDARVLEWSAPMPNDVIVGHGALAQDDHRRFGDALLALGATPDGARMLSAALHAERFVPTPFDAVPPLWDLVAAARSRGLLPRIKTGYTLPPS